MHFALSWKLARCVLIKDYQTLLAVGDLVIAQNETRGFQNPWPYICKGLGMVGMGKNLEAGIHIIEKAIADFEHVKSFSRWRSLRYKVSAQACELAGDFERALEAAKKAIQGAEEIGEKVVWADLLGHYGHLLVARGHAADEKEGERLLLDAISFGKGQQCMLFQLRATTHLARLWRDQENYSDAQQVLALIYTSFKEGGDTSDLKAAKALLES